MQGGLCMCVPSFRGYKKQEFLIPRAVRKMKVLIKFSATVLATNFLGSSRRKAKISFPNRDILV